MAVGTRFTKFLQNLTLTDTQVNDGITKHTGVRRALNQHYWGSSDGYANSILVGSWGKSTEIRPPRDIDILFKLPKNVYDRYQQLPYGRNKQSELLQEVKRVLERSYTTTDMRGDGQVVTVKFGSYAVEVAPAFALQNSAQFWICNTHAGGSYKTVDPVAEQEAVKLSNDRTKGNTRDLIRMMKCWQAYCSVPMKSFWIELVAVDFLGTWRHAGNTTVYYDYIVRDFLAHLVARANWTFYVPGTRESIMIGSNWISRAESALERAKKACDYEAATRDFDAGYEWQKIFGDAIPLTT